MDVAKSIAAVTTGLAVSAGAAVAFVHTPAAPPPGPAASVARAAPPAIWGSAMPVSARDRRAVIRRCAGEARDAGRREIDPACLRRSVEGSR